MLNRFSRFSLAIAEIDRCWHKLAAEEMAKHDLNSPHAVYLNTLYQYEEGIGGNLYRAKLLTEEEKQAAAHIRERVAVTVELAGTGLSDETRETFYTALEQITANLQTLSKEGLP